MNKFLYKKLIFLIPGLSCFLIAGILLWFVKPFEQQSYYQTSMPTVINNDTISDTDNVAGTVKNTVVHNYDTEYGDLEVAETDNILCQAFVDAFFNVGYRSITLNQDNYINSALTVFPDGNVNSHAYRFDSKQFATFIATMLVDQQIQPEASWQPYTTYTYDHITVVNGDITLTFHSGEDLTEIARFFKIEEPELNTAYNIPVCFKISHTTGNIVSFAPEYEAIQ